MCNNSIKTSTTVQVQPFENFFFFKFNGDDSRSETHIQVCVYVTFNLIKYIALKK